MEAREKRALKLARHQAKASPAGRRMRGAELAAWRRHWFQWHLDREGLGEYFHKYEPLATKTRDEDRVKASHASDAARYRRAYGR